MKASQKLALFTGVVRANNNYQGSKSQRTSYYLEVADEQLELHVEGDNPFTPMSLAHLENKKITANGRLDVKKLTLDPLSITEVEL